MYIFTLILTIIIILILLYLNRKEIKLKFILNIILTIGLVGCSVVWVNYFLTSDPYGSYKIAQNNDWISFWGSLLGGLVSGITTLIVLYITVNSNKEINNETLESSKQLYLTSQEDSKKFYFDDTIRKIHPYIICDIINNPKALYEFFVFNENDNPPVKYNVIDVLRLTNIGIGTAIHIDLSILRSSNPNYKGSNIHMQNGNMCVLPHIYLKPEDFFDINIHMDLSGLKQKSTFVLRLEFSDIHMNRWYQDIYLAKNNSNNKLQVLNTNSPKASYINRSFFEEKK